MKAFIIATLCVAYFAPVSSQNGRTQFKNQFYGQFQQAYPYQGGQDFEQQQWQDNGQGQGQFGQNNQFAQNQNNQFGQSNQFGQGGQFGAGDEECRQAGGGASYAPHPSDCHMFYRCVYGQGFLMTCKDQEVFDRDDHFCRSQRQGEC